MQNREDNVIWQAIRPGKQSNGPKRTTATRRSLLIQHSTAQHSSYDGYCKHNRAYFSSGGCDISHLNDQTSTHFATEHLVLLWRATEGRARRNRAAADRSL